VPEPTPIKGIRGIDPNVFVDKDQKAYLYWSQGNIYGAGLKDNMQDISVQCGHTAGTAHKRAERRPLPV
jgi:beta-xylosidase